MPLDPYVDLYIHISVEHELIFLAGDKVNKRTAKLSRSLAPQPSLEETTQLGVNLAHQILYALTEVEDIVRPHRVDEVMNESLKIEITSEELGMDDVANFSVSKIVQMDHENFRDFELTRFAFVKLRKLAEGEIGDLITKAYNLLPQHA